MHLIIEKTYIHLVYKKFSTNSGLLMTNVIVLSRIGLEILDLLITIRTVRF